MDILFKLYAPRLTGLSWRGGPRPTGSKKSARGKPSLLGVSIFRVSVLINSKPSRAGAWQQARLCPRHGHAHATTAAACHSSAITATTPANTATCMSTANSHNHLHNRINITAHHIHTHPRARHRLAQAHALTTHAHALRLTCDRSRS